MSLEPHLIGAKPEVLGTTREKFDGREKMAAVLFAAVLSQAPSLPCAACGFAHAHLASTFESLKGSNNIPAAMEDEIEQLCQTDDQLSAYAPLRRACESLLEKYDEALILSAMAGEAAGTACLRFVESKDCDGEAAKAAMARFSVPITSEPMQETTTRGRAKASCVVSCVRAFQRRRGSLASR